MSTKEAFFTVCDDNRQQLYDKLSKLAAKHALLIYRNRHTANGRHRLARMPTCETWARRWNTTQFSGDSFIVADVDHKETVDILGSGDAESLCLRIHWYLSYFPDFF